MYEQGRGRLRPTVLHHIETIENDSIDLVLTFPRYVP